MAYRVYGWVCKDLGCPGFGYPVWSRGKGPKRGQWIYKAPVCRQCKRPMVRVEGMEKMHYTLAEML